MPQSAMPSGLAWATLRGEDFPELGDLAVRAVGEGTAVALSAGAHPKAYLHLDANEDACLAAEAPTGTLLACADGHHGFDAARAAIDAVEARRGALETVLFADPVEVAADVLEGARAAVAEALGDADDLRRDSRTALSLALLARGRVVVGGWGDSQVLRVRGRRAKALLGERPFLDRLAPSAEPRAARLRPGDVVVVCSDGLRDYLAGWPRRVAALVGAADGPEVAARDLVEAAWAGGAGDHVSVALTQAAG